MVKSIVKEDADGNIVINFKGDPSRRRGSRLTISNIERFYASRYKKFIKVGYTPDEAEWAASKGLHFGITGVRKAANRRKTIIRKFMKKHGMTKEEAIEQAFEDKLSQVQRTGEDENDIFVY